MPGVDSLPTEDVRNALRLLGADEATIVNGSSRALRERFTGPGQVHDLLGLAPAGAADAFRRLAVDGAASVEDLLGRGWAGVGVLPSPLDWLQRRALITVGRHGLVHATDEARQGFAAPDVGLQAELTFDLAAEPEPDAPLVVEAATTVIIAPSRQDLDAALAVPGAALVAVSPTVAISQRSPGAVEAALASAGLSLSSASGAPTADEAVLTLPGTEEDAVGPRAIRTLLSRALDEGRQVRLEYYASSRGGQGSERVVDPWQFSDDLLRGWCHLREDERAFAVDRIGRARLLAARISHPAPTS